jgi:hypothetical protein
MTVDAVGLRHVLRMGAMAFGTLWYVSMFRVVTGMTEEFRVLRDVCLHFPVQFRMAYVTALFKGPVGGNFFWCMRFAVTILASGQLRPVHFLVTGFTFGHDFFIGVFARSIDVKPFVARFTIDLMFAAGGLDQIENTTVTSSAVLRIQRLNVSTVNFR